MTSFPVRHLEDTTTTYWSIIWLSTDGGVVQEIVIVFASTTLVVTVIGSVLQIKMNFKLICNGYSLPDRSGLVLNAMSLAAGP